MATLTNLISPPSPAGKPYADTLAGASAKGDRSLGDFAQLMSGAIEAQTNAPTPNPNPGAGDVRASSPLNRTGAPSGLTDTQTMLNQIQAKINTLLTQNPPLTASAQQSLKMLQQQLAEVAATLRAAADPRVDSAAEAVLGAKTLSDLQKELDQLQTLLSQSDKDGSNWSTQVQAMALNLAQGLNPSFSSKAALTGTTQVGINSSRDGLNQAGMAINAKNNALTAQNNQASTLSHSDGSQVTSSNANLVPDSRTAAQLIAAQMANGAASPQNQMNSSSINQNLSHLLVDNFNSGDSNPSNSAQLNTAQTNLTISPPAADLSATLSIGLPTSLPAAGFGSIATHSVWATLPGALDLNQAKMPGDLGQNIQWMLGKNISRATLDINPANLGPLKITIDQQRDQIQIQIMAAHHLTRDALDQAIPRLREWLQDAGLNHAEVTIASFDSQSGQNPFFNQNQEGGQASGSRQPASHNALGAPPAIDADNVKMADGAVQKLTSLWRLDTFV
jgi:flagellar hook-length control protein FliK